MTRLELRYDESVRMSWLGFAALIASCAPPSNQYGRGTTYYAQPELGTSAAPMVAAPVEPPPVTPLAPNPGQVGTLVAQSTDFAFDGGLIEFELRRDGERVLQIARSRYVVPVMMKWTVSTLENLSPLTPTSGVVLLPPAAVMHGRGAALLLAELRIDDPALGYRRELQFRARFGDPRARPSAYAYHLPYKRGTTFSVLQGFHGSFSHRGSNEYAVDFDCPVATPVVAARPGIIVASNARAQGSGTSADFLEYKRVNFVLVLHDDSTLGEYMHLAPSGVQVAPGQRVERGQELALSGNTGFSSTPHLHFQLMTAAEDGVSAQSFPFELAVTPERAEPPVQGQTYLSWE